MISTIDSPFVSFDPIAGVYYDAVTGDMIDSGSTYPDSNDTLPITAAQNRTNLQLAAAQAAAELPPNKNNWTGNQAAEYVRNFVGIILGDQDAFSTETVAVAQQINLNRTYDYAFSDPNKLINPNQIIVGLTDIIAPAVDAVSPLANAPGEVIKVGQEIVTAARQIITGLGNAAATSPILLPIAAIAIVYFLAKNAAGDIRSSVRF